MTESETRLEAAAVAEYLRAHPDFLPARPELWGPTGLPSSEDGVASLAAYQLRVLRERQRQLEAQLAELGTIAEENLRLMERIHALSLSLLATADPADIVRRIGAWLDEEGQTPLLRLFLFGRMPETADPSWLVALPEGAAALPEFEAEVIQAAPQAGRLSPERLQRLFGAEAAGVHSVALLPLNEHGLLAIGSHDPDRFQPGMGTVFLKMIADTVTAALKRCQEAA